MNPDTIHLPVSPRYCMFSDSDFIYCYAMKKESIFNPIPVFFQIDKNNLSITQCSNLHYKNKIDDYVDLIWNKTVGWVFYSKTIDNHTIQYHAIPILWSDTIHEKKLFSVVLEKNQTLTHANFYTNSDASLISFFAIIHDASTHNLKFNTLCFDSKSLKLMTANNYAFPYEVANAMDAASFNVKINREGEPQFIFKTYIQDMSESRKIDGRKQANYYFKYIVLEKTGRINEIPINTNGNYIKSIDFLIRDNHAIIAAYMYAKPNFKNLKGLFFNSISADSGSIESFNEILFNTKTISAFDIVSDEKIKQGLDYDRVDYLTIKNILIAEDSSVFVLGEIDFMKIVPTGRRRIKTNLISGNIIVTKLTTSGEHIWTQIIPKSQLVNDHMIGSHIYQGTAHSFASYTSKNQLHLFFNDNENNYRSSSISNIKEWNGGNTGFVHVLFNPDGHYEMIEVLRKYDHPLAIDINSVVKIDDSSVFIFDYNTIGKLNLNSK
jgi:hypothetical protein